MLTATADPSTAIVHDTELIVSRTLSAPRSLVWKAFTQPEHIIHWWGPTGFTNTFHEFSFTEGGVWRFIMHGPDGTDYNNRVIFTEITPMDRIAYDHDDDNTNGLGFKAVITFEDQGTNTFITLHMTAPSAVMMDQMKKFGAVEGAKQNLARLEAYLQNMQ
jgi:uncharacterized protein YndB with AHSA1/START domain